MKRIRWTYITEKSSRRCGLAIFVGLIAGLISGIVKLGWEVILPPRVLDRITPPQLLLENLGVNVHEMTYVFSGHVINYGNFIIHFGFSVVTVIAYCFVAEIWPKVKLWQGCAAGLVFWVVAHLFIMPLIGLTPPALELPFDEQLSEIFGHMVWMWTAEIFRRDLRSRITHRPDPEFYR